ncbi:RNA methyltransferase [Magnetococcales bacterium HHB-1]
MSQQSQQVWNDITVILDRPAHGGNVGAVLRAMANMGLTNLRLVQPRQFPHPDVENFAAGAKRYIEQIQVFSTLKEAVADCNFLVATTNRHRGQRQVVWTPRQLAENLPQTLAWSGTRLGLMFGSERMGLETVDVERADVICNIPTAGKHGSLNLAQAVLVICYELMLSLSAQAEAFDYEPRHEDHAHERASSESLERFFDHLQETLLDIEFIRLGKHRHMMGSLRAIFHRAALDQREVSILRGILHETIAYPKRQQENLLQKISTLQDKMASQDKKEG